MDNTLSLGNRVLSAVVATLTILWAAGAAAFVVPQTANAAEAGDLIRGTSFSTVYFYGYDGARYIFPNEKTYDTWFNGFSGVQTLSDSAVAAIPVAGNVVYRPGSRWIKITTAAETYAVARDGMIHWIETEAVASGLAGSDWNQSIDDVPDAFFDNYTEGVSLTEAEAWNGALFMDGGNYYVAWDGEKRMLSSAARSANALETRFFLDGASIDDSSLDAGDDITGFVCELSDASQSGDCSDVSDVMGDVTVARATSTPAGATLPGGANSVPVLSFTVKAGAEAAEFNSVTLSFEGIAATTNISNVYLYEGANRLTEARSVNSSTREVTFGSLGLDLAANQTRTLTARVDVSTSQTSGDEFYFTIDGADAVEASGNAGGSFPVAGNTFKLGGQDVGTVTVVKNGTITNPTIGGGDAVIGQFKVTSSGEDVTISEITLKVDNGADHSNFKIWNTSNTLLGTGSYIGDKLVAFTLNNPVSIDDGNSQIFKVSANIGGESSDAIKVYLDNSADLVAVGDDYGFGNAVTRTGYDGDSCTSSSGDCSYSTIQGGDVTFAFKGPTTGDIRTNSQDQVLLEFTLTTQEEITIKDLDIIVYGDDDDNDATDAVDDGTDNDDDGLIQGSGTNVANITDIKIRNAATGKTVMGPLELDGVADSDDDADQTIDFSDDWTLGAGQSVTLQVTADIDDGVTSGTEFAAAIDISGFVAEDENGDNLTNSTDVVPTGDIIGNNLTASSASLAVSLSSTPGDITAVHGMNDITVAKFNIQGGDTGAVDISQIVVSVYSDDNNSTFTLGDTSPPDVNDYVESCTIYDNEGNALDAATSPASNGATITFDGVNWTIEASENEVLEVRCNFANPTATTTYYFAWDLNDVSEDIVAQDEDGTDVDPTGDDPNGGTTPTNVVTLEDVGTLATSLDASSPSGDILLTGSNDNLAAVFRVTSAYEDFTVKRLTVTEEAAEDINGTSNSNAYVNNISRVTLKYPTAGGQGTKSATMNGNEALFTNLDLYVPADGHSLVQVYVDVPSTTRSTGSTPNEYLSMGLSVDTSADDQFEAIGGGSGSTLDDDDVSAVATAARHVIKETKPTISVNAQSPSGVKTPGTIEVFRFNVAAAAGEDVVVKEILFTVSATDNASSNWNYCDTANDGGNDLDAGDFSLYDLSDEGLASALEGSDSDWTPYESTSGAPTACAATPDGDIAFLGLDLTTPVVIPAGTTHVFALYMNTAGASAANDDSIQISIPAEWSASSSSPWIVDSNGIDEATTAKTDTTLSVDDGTVYSEGDIICIDEGDDGCGTADEKALVTAVATNDLTIVRGYLGTNTATAANIANSDDLYRLPSTFFWEDDGDASTGTTGDEWGAYLVDTLSATGNGISF